MPKDRCFVEIDTVVIDKYYSHLDIFWGGF